MWKGEAKLEERLEELSVYHIQEAIQIFKKKLIGYWIHGGEMDELDFRFEIKVPSRFRRTHARPIPFRTISVRQTCWHVFKKSDCS